VSRKAKDKPIVKVPRSAVGRAVFAGTQVAGAVAVARSLRDARAKDDKLAQLYGGLNAAVLVVTALIAVRTMRAADEIVDAELVEPLMLTAGK
jgi:uncharacterized protein (DUF433 family)